MTTSRSRLRPLKGVRVLSLALNLPGPAALKRCRDMGATCIKLEPPAPEGRSGDPMAQFNAQAYAQLHDGIRVRTAHLKTDAGRAVLHRELAKADVLLTSFRPSALARLQLGWAALSRQYPQLSQVAIVGASGERAEEPGHDLTYVAEQGLIDGLSLPATLYADMGGSLMTSEAVLQAMLARARKGRGVRIEVALAEAARYLGSPRAWGLTGARAVLGGAHAGYKVYECKDGRVAVAALEPHFAAALCAAAGLREPTGKSMFHVQTHRQIAEFLASRTRQELTLLAREKDVPMHTLPE